MPANDADAAIAAAYLDRARPFPGENRFALGTFERGITLYRQQVRAFNLVYAMVEARAEGGVRIVPERSRVVVIGGGAFGVTVAAAAARAGFDARLLERHEELLHLQRGCDTRWIHPHSYDWPAPGSESQLARLPLLDWQAAKAADVAAGIVEQYRDIQADSGCKLQTICEARDIQVEKVEGAFQVAFASRDMQDIWPAEVVVYAVGFGIEEAAKAPYWRNDELSQGAVGFRNGERVPFVVAGLGDGALVDVFRLTIRDFRQDRILREMFPQDQDTADLKDVLGHLRREAATSGSREGWFYDRLKETEAGGGGAGKALKRAQGLLGDRRRHDTTVWLVSRRRDMRDGLRLDAVSLSNALLAYCLFRVGAVRHQQSEVDTKGPSHPALPTPIDGLSPSRVIYRLGTKRGEVLRDAGLPVQAVERVRGQGRTDSGRPIYPAGWWGRYTMPGMAGENEEPARVEYVPPALCMYATTFVSTLASSIGAVVDAQASTPAADGEGATSGSSPVAGEKLRFRFALHRTARFDEEEFFQQVTRYYGRTDSQQGVGRIFPIRNGLVGLACRFGECVTVDGKGNDALKPLWQKTSLRASGAKAVKPDVASLLVLPLLAPPREGQPPRVLMVLFADANTDGFFNASVVAAIAASCHGFIDLLESLAEERMLRQIDDFDAVARTGTTDGDDAARETYEASGARFLSLDPVRLAFRTLETLDLELGHAAMFAPRLRSPVPNDGTLLNDPPPPTAPGEGAGRG